MLIVRQSTTRIVTVGPVLDADGAAVTTAVVGDFKGSVNGGNPAALNGSATLTHRHTGHYSLSLTATDLATVGSFEVTLDKTTDACPPKELTVIEEVIYDALFAASSNAFAGAAGSTTLGAGAITATVIATAAIDADSIAADAITDAKVASDVTIASVTGAVGSVTGAVGSVTGSVGSVASGGITTASFAAGAINAAAIAADAIGASELASDAVAEIADAVWDEVLSGHLTAGSTGNALNAAGSAGDPWSTSLPGAYGAGSAGLILGTNLNATVSSRATPAQVNTEADSALADVGLTTTITGRIDAAVTTRATPAQVNAEVLDVVSVDTFAEPGQEAPAATNTLAKKIGFLFKAFRNKFTQDATTAKLYDDAGTTVDQKATVSDDAVTFTRGEMGTGP